MPAKTCKHCHKRSYVTPDWAYRAALNSSRTFGTPFRVYKCPHNSRVYHVVGKRKRG